MTSSNVIELAVAAGILITGLVLLWYLRSKFRRLDGFEGIVTEDSLIPRRTDPDWAKELTSLEKSMEENRATPDN